MLLRKAFEMQGGSVQSDLRGYIGSSKMRLVHHIRGMEALSLQQPLHLPSDPQIQYRQGPKKTSIYYRFGSSFYSRSIAYSLLGMIEFECSFMNASLAL